MSLDEKSSLIAILTRHGLPNVASNMTSEGKIDFQKLRAMMVDDLQNPNLKTPETDQKLKESEQDKDLSGAITIL